MMSGGKYRCPAAATDAPIDESIGCSGEPICALKNTICYHNRDATYYGMCPTWCAYRRKRRRAKKPAEGAE